ncbi:MAG: lysozyme inhibitor LprI family protein [Methylotetracoccus sp.]
MRAATKWALALVLGIPAVALADGPAFNCAKAEGQVQKLICSDASLAARDRKLDEVYKAASAKAQGKLQTQLRAEQRGWVKGRDDCWKTQSGTPTWLTASWTANSVKECVEGQYRIRTTELQSVWRLLAPRTVSFSCQNDPANEVVANFFATDPPTIRLERGDRTVTMWQVGPVNDGKYEGQNVSLEHKANEMHVSWLNVETGVTDDLKCKAR